MAKSEKLMKLYEKLHFNEVFGEIKTEGLDQLDQHERLNTGEKILISIINAYSAKNNGVVEDADIDTIANDVISIAREMIANIGNVNGRLVNPIYPDIGSERYYCDLHHELCSVGKVRQENAMNMIVTDPEKNELMNSYLNGTYTETIEQWSSAFYYTAKILLMEKLREGIDAYRGFVDGLPYKNINRLANTLGLETEVASFLAQNGSLEDFQLFMTSEEPIERDDDSLSEERQTEIKSCPEYLTEKIMNTIRDSIQNGSYSYFNRKELMKGLSAIHRSNEITPNQKDNLQDLLMEDFVTLGNDQSIVSLMKNKDVRDKYNVAREYLNIRRDTHIDTRKARSEYRDQLFQSIIKRQFDSVTRNLMLIEAKGKVTDKDVTRACIEAGLKVNDDSSVHLEKGKKDAVENNNGSSILWGFQESRVNFNKEIISYSSRNPLNRGDFDDKIEIHSPELIRLLLSARRNRMLDIQEKFPHIDPEELKKELEISTGRLYDEDDYGYGRMGWYVNGVLLTNIISKSTDVENRKAELIDFANAHKEAILMILERGESILDFSALKSRVAIMEEIMEARKEINGHEQPNFSLGKVASAVEQNSKDVTPGN